MPVIPTSRAHSFSLRTDKKEMSGTVMFQIRTAEEDGAKWYIMLEHGEKVRRFLGFDNSDPVTRGENGRKR